MQLFITALSLGPSQKIFNIYPLLWFRLFPLHSKTPIFSLQHPAHNTVQTTSLLRGERTGRPVAKKATRCFPHRLLFFRLIQLTSSPPSASFSLKADLTGLHWRGGPQLCWDETLREFRNDWAENLKEFRSREDHVAQEEQRGQSSKVSGFQSYHSIHHRGVSKVETVCQWVICPLVSSPTLLPPTTASEAYSFEHRATPPADHIQYAEFKGTVAWGQQLLYNQWQYQGHAVV